MKPHIDGSSVTVLLNVWAGDDLSRFERSLESVFSQTLSNFQLLIVSDGPLPPEFEALIEKFLNCASTIKVSHVKSLPQMGLWFVRNTGIRLIETKYTALHDADDIMHPERLEIQLRQLEMNSIDVLGSSILEFDPYNYLITGARNVAETHDEIKKIMKSRNPMHHSSIMLRTSIVKEFGYYRDVYLTEDYDLWIRLMAHGSSFANDSRALVAFCRDSSLMARRSGIGFVMAEWQILKEKIRTNLNNFLNAPAYFIMRLTYRIGPKSLRQNVHSRILNSPSEVEVRNIDEFMVLTYKR